jgi:hypothetical protein
MNRITKRELAESVFAAGRPISDIALALETTEEQVAEWVGYVPTKPILQELYEALLGLQNEAGCWCRWIGREMPVAHTECCQKAQAVVHRIHVEGPFCEKGAGFVRCPVCRSCFTP